MVNKTRVAEYESLFEEIRSGNEVLLDKIYQEYRNGFISWATRKLNLSGLEAAEIYQELMLAFYENIMNDKLTSLRSSLKTYLYGIGRVLARRKFSQKKKRGKLFQETEYEVEVADFTFTEEIRLTHRQTLMKTAIEKLGASCKKLILLFFYKMYSTEAVMHTLEYNSTDVVRSRKKYCLNKLKEIIQTDFKGDLF